MAQDRKELIRAEHKHSCIGPKTYLSSQAQSITASFLLLMRQRSKRDIATELFEQEGLDVRASAATLHRSVSGILISKQAKDSKLRSPIY